MITLPSPAQASGATYTQTATYDQAGFQRQLATAQNRARHSPRQSGPQHIPDLLDIPIPRHPPRQSNPTLIANRSHITAIHRHHRPVNSACREH